MQHGCELKVLVRALVPIYHVTTELLVLLDFLIKNKLSRGTFPMLSRDPFFHATIKTPGETAGFLKRMMTQTPRNLDIPSSLAPITSSQKCHQ